MINVELTEWETMVLRSAVSKHMLDAPSQHVEACREIMRKATLMNFHGQEQPKELVRGGAADRPGQQPG